MLKVGDFLYSKTAKKEFWPAQVTQQDATNNKLLVKFLGNPRVRPKWVSTTEVVGFDPLVECPTYGNERLNKALSLLKKELDECNGSK